MYSLKISYRLFVDSKFLNFQHSNDTYKLFAPSKRLINFPWKVHELSGVVSIVKQNFFYYILILLHLSSLCPSLIRSSMHSIIYSVRTCTYHARCSSISLLTDDKRKCIRTIAARTKRVVNAVVFARKRSHTALSMHHDDDPRGHRAICSVLSVAQLPCVCKFTVG